MIDLVKFTAKLQKTKTEEEVKAAWAGALGLTYNTSEDHDLYTPAVLFEFKHDKNLSQAQQLAPVVAQVMYYLHRLKTGQTRKAIPPYFCVAEKKACVLAEVLPWRDLYTDEAGQFDWDLRPSSPDPALIAAVRGHMAFKNLFSRSLLNAAEGTAVLAQLEALFSPQAALPVIDKKLITEANFEEVFDFWNEMFGDAVRNGFKSSRYFVADIQHGRTQVVANEGKVYFQVGAEDVRIKKILAHDYQRFWSLFEKVTSSEVTRGIVAKVDRLTDEVDRRKHGEFFTPLAFAQKALHYLEHELGRRWWESGEYRVWDMAAGTGNLEYHLPAAAWQFVYLSTLYKEDVEHLDRLFAGATIFQYDYLNDDVGNVFSMAKIAESQVQANLTGLDYSQSMTWKMPANLRRDLANPRIKWVILINPPFATAQQGGATGANKSDVANTVVRSIMHHHNLGETSRELFAQFLFRIKQEFESKVAWLGLFAKLKYVNATNDQKLRDDIFQYQFNRGFMFSSVNFSGTSASSQFPVGFLIWNLAKKKSIESQTVSLDVYDTQILKLNKKRLGVEHRSGFLSKWISRPKTTRVFVPFSSAMSVKSKGPDIRDRIADGFLGSLMCAGNDIQHQNMTALLSGPYASAGALSITQDIFEQALLVHAVRRIPKAHWHNDRDQFLQPSKPVPVEFVLDSVVWSLYANSNETTAMRDVTYGDERYQIPNHFFPIALSTLKTWSVSDSDIRIQLPNAADRFVAQWLQDKPLSDEAVSVVDAGAAVFRVYFENLHQLRTSKFKIETWDAGWWQVRQALADRELGVLELAALKKAHAALREKLLPSIESLGFLP
jgi:hypothetical protein